MLSLLIENLATILISAVLFTALVLISANLIKKKKAGKSAGCGYGCSGCSNSSVCGRH
ncbi:FeoB-associated Cys-rich membrane protein [Papillibacter cinnamivorans]|uniref:Virus attachment protein p12 family protein n=1 Tax=Papillibacter cinnamivorans DSM 12816 TaxID=1122930 RepID=A0A1W2AUK4_9FIRM|nr:FeoB-associated Cys-rich membrane protein [Papillibacter cinnamivorans]SMC64200.1 Virus attachment protein p12 family protein [Papillibacter cinnamivorans DSM 12816]